MANDGRLREWPDEWWLTREMEMSRDVELFPCIFTKKHLRSHLSTYATLEVGSTLSLACHHLPTLLASVSRLLVAVCESYLHGFLRFGGSDLQMMYMACCLVCVVRTLHRRIHLFNQSVSPLYEQIMCLGCSDPSNPTFFHFMAAFRNHCDVLRYFAETCETYALDAEAAAFTLGIHA